MKKRASLYPSQLFCSQVLWRDITLDCRRESWQLLALCLRLNGSLCWLHALVEVCVRVEESVGCSVDGAVCRRI